MLISMISFAQKGIIRGKVTDENNLPLPGAIIAVDDYKMITDFDGNYIVINVLNANHSVTTSYLGFASQRKEVMVKDNTIVLNFTLEPEVNSLNEVIIKGSIGKGQAKALNKQKNNINVTNVVAADQVGKFPDSNIGDALKRIPGIAVQNDQGEARNIIVRGLATQLNSVTLNGERIPSAEGDNRNVQLDLIPSDMVQAIEVNKVVTPDMDGDAIGGSVNLVTRAANAKRIVATVGYGQNLIRETPIYNASVIVSDRFFNNKLGAVITGSIQTNEIGSDNVEFEWAEGDYNDLYIAEHDIRRYDLTRQRESVALNLDYKLNHNNTLYFNGVYNTRKDWENRYKLRFKNDEVENTPGVFETEVIRETKGGTEKDARLEKQQIQSYSLKGEHVFKTVKLDWTTSYSKASEERPNERYMIYTQEGLNFRQNLNNTESPYMIPDNDDYNDFSLFEFDELTEENQWTYEENYNFKTNVEIPLNKKLKVKTGYKFQLKSKVRDNNFTEYDPIEEITNIAFSDYTLDDFQAGKRYVSGNFVTEGSIGSLALKNTALYDGALKLDEFVPGNYKAEENINAGYGMLTANVYENLIVLVGLRVENTNIDYTGYRIDVEKAGDLSDVTALNATKNYTNVMPNLQVKYAVNNDVIRLAYSNSIARPNYYDLVPYQEINSEDLEFSEGNPTLKATESLNFDLMFEHYFSSVGIFSFGAFHKTLDNFIFNYVTDDYQDTILEGDFEYSQKRNGDQAEVYGIEAALQTKLGFIHKKLNDFNLYLNYTHTNSTATGIEGRESEDLELAGAVDNMFNASLAYETKKLTLRASLNHASDYIDEYGDEAFEDRYYDVQTFVDLNGNYEILKGLRLFGEVKNLTNQSLRYYQGSKDYTMQNEFYGVNWSMGVKYNF